MDKDLKKGIIWLLAIPILLIIGKVSYSINDSSIVSFFGANLDFYEALNIISIIALVISTYFFSSYSRIKKVIIIIPVISILISVIYLLLFNLTAIFD